MSQRSGAQNTSTPPPMVKDSSVAASDKNPAKQASNTTNQTMSLGVMGPMAGASDMTKHSSQAVVSNNASSNATTTTKKVLQFRLFKSLKQATDISTKY